MYTRHFKLSVLPFENVPDPAFFFDGGDYNRVLQRMTDALEAGRGLMAVAGPIGSGKTTLSHKLMADLTDSTKLVWMAEPPEKALDLFLFLSQEIGAEEASSTLRVFLLRDIRKGLQQLRARGGRCLMIIDESHLMSDDALEGIRLLNNLEEGAAKLVQIVLLGQPELMDQLSRPELEPFRQRIAGLEVIGKMKPERVREYILHRLQVAGGGRNVFSDTALEAIALSTGGVPRITNSLCNRSLTVTYEENKATVDVEDVHRAAMDLGLGRTTMHYLLKLRADQPDEPPPPSEKEEATASRAEEERETVSSTDTEPAVATPEGPPAGIPRERPRLRLPLMMLASSLAALAASLWLYCVRAGTAGADPCLKGLVRSLF